MVCMFDCYIDVLEKKEIMGFIGSEIDVECGNCHTIYETNTATGLDIIPSCLPSEPSIHFFQCSKCGNKIEIYWERKNISRKRKREEWVTDMKSINGKVSYSSNRM